MTRTRIALSLTTLGLAGLLGLSGCGVTPAAAGPAPSVSASAAPKVKHPGAAKFLRKNTLHGEVTVQGKDGVRTVVVQRGTVTAVDAKSVSVKSSDGFTLTWTFGEKLRVVQDKKKAEPTAIKQGAEIGVVGTATVATLIKIK
jgi:hypothetical protein